jgi:hypothetical protein
VLRALRASGRGKILCAWTSDLRVGRATSVLVSEHIKVSLISVVGKRKIHHAAKEKGHANT